MSNVTNTINKIIEEDLRNVKNRSSSQNKAIPFDELLKPPSIIKAAFYIETDHSQDPVLFHYAHWIMSMSTLRSLAEKVIQMLRDLKSFYSNYMKNVSSQERWIAFNHFVCVYQDFNGYLTSIRHTITQYYDLFVQLCNEIDPNYKEEKIIQYKSDIDHFQLLAAIKELILHGSIGKTSWFFTS